ncbi:MAG TPA: rod shape-determining protein RodA, partial [Desulfobacterales bacterium]|nr:rod shape-determining protein RodA [Desulfobacterales bacterium]
MFDRRLVENFDWGFVLLILTICIAGLVVLYSALTAGHDAGVVHTLFKKQIIWMGAGFIIMIISLMIDYRELDKLNLFIYALCVGLLISVFFFDHFAVGSRRWFLL